eukprot:8949138-Pyramimonas_sp.AAC.3
MAQSCPRKSGCFSRPGRRPRRRQSNANRTRAISASCSPQGRLWCAPPRSSHDRRSSTFALRI